MKLCRLWLSLLVAFFKFPFSTIFSIVLQVATIAIFYLGKLGKKSVP